MQRLTRSLVRFKGKTTVQRYRQTCTCSLKTNPTKVFRPLLLTFRFESGLLLLGGSDGRPGHTDSQQRQQDSSQQPGPRGHPVSGGQRSPYPPSPPPPGHWSHLRGSAQPSTAAGSALSLTGIHPITWAEKWKSERERRKGRWWRSVDWRGGQWVWTERWQEEKKRKILVWNNYSDLH